jgi:YfiH family protein
MPLTLSPLLGSVPGLTHGFTNKQVSRLEAAALDAATATAKQVHKADLVWITKWEKREREADAVATFTPNLAVGVYSADCTPVLAAAIDEDSGKPFGVLAVHGGWRGTASGISGSAFREFASAALKERGAVSFVAAVGPCISFENFEVGEEVARAFRTEVTRFLRLEGEKKKFLVNLPGENRRQLLEAASGLSVRLEVDCLDLCTLKQPDVFPSYRREGSNAGRILSFLRF